MTGKVYLIVPTEVLVDSFKIHGIASRGASRFHMLTYDASPSEHWRPPLHTSTNPTYGHLF